MFCFQIGVDLIRIFLMFIILFCSSRDTIVLTLRLFILRVCIFLSICYLAITIDIQFKRHYLDHFGLLLGISFHCYLQIIPICSQTVYYTKAPMIVDKRPGNNHFFFVNLPISITSAEANKHHYSMTYVHIKIKKKFAFLIYVPCLETLYGCTLRELFIA